ncbi:hypothetical protein CRYUN_Cryun23aG0130100 [Craigia yunnanensis]
MSEPPLKPVLQKPPGYKDPGSPAVQPGFRPPQRKRVLPPSFHPKKKNSSCCRVCCCCFCIFFLILFLLLIICGAIFYLWFDPKLPGFHVQSFRISRFDVSKKTDGTYLDATMTTRIEVKNPNGKMTYYYGDTEVDVSLGQGGDETDLGTTTVPEFSLGKQKTTSLKVETKASNKLVVDGVGDRLLTRYRSKTLPVNVEARTKVGLGVAGMKIGMLGVTVKCDGITMKQLDGGEMPKCIINTLKCLTQTTTPVPVSQPLVTYLVTNPGGFVKREKKFLSGAKMEYVSPEGLRLDGRRPMEMGQLRAEIGTAAKADGSAVFEMGNTKVIAVVYGPREVQNRSQQISDQALVRCEYSMANFSTGDHMRKPKGDRRSTEISLVIRQTMEACILTHLMPRSQIDIFVQVLQANGGKRSISRLNVSAGTRSACINAATLALADAGIPMSDIVTSCSAGYLNSTPLLDLN